MQRAQGRQATLTGTLETCVLGGRVDPLAQSKKRMEGDQEPPPCPSHQELLVLGPMPPLQPKTEFQEPACLPQQSG